MSFSNLGLSEKVLKAVTAAGYNTPTPIQEQAIPHVLARRDVLGIAQTGTGKTAAFVLPMLTLLEKGRARARMPRTLILEPTRELAAQVKENFDKYGVGQKLNVALLIGGVSFGDQDAKLTRGVDVLIATPGRLLDHTERGGLLLTGVEMLIIDEADRMLDMGFIPDIERICKLVPFTRQTLFFTATMPPEIRRITEAFLHNPERVEVAKPATTNVTLTQSFVTAGREPHEKRDILRQLIRSAKDLQNAIIFCNRKREVALLHKSLVRHGFSAVALHGDMDQPARMAALDQFRKGEAPLLVASDVAARGLDIPEVSHVYNFDVPHHADDYVHRVGRTGRAGRSGTAISIVAPIDQKSLGAIEKLIGQTIPKLDGFASVPSEPHGEGEEQRPRESRGSRHPRRSQGGKSGKPRGEGRAPSRDHAPRDNAPRDRTPARDHASTRDHAPRDHTPARDQAAAPAPKQRPPSIGRAPSRPAEPAGQPTDAGDQSHLPAFLLRPTRARA